MGRCLMVLIAVCWSGKKVLVYDNEIVRNYYSSYLTLIVTTAGTRTVVMCAEPSQQIHILVAGCQYLCNYVILSTLLISNAALFLPLCLVANYNLRVSLHI